MSEAWGLTMVEFMKLADVKKRAVLLASGAPEPVSQDETDAVEANLRARGILDDKGLVRNG
jgi:hypothetical protein